MDQHDKASPSPADLDFIPALEEALSRAQKGFDRYNRQAFPRRPPEFFALELSGEAGELANKEKKLWKGRAVDCGELADEAADVFIAVVNYANSRGMDLAAAVAGKLREIERRRLERLESGDRGASGAAPVPAPAAPPPSGAAPARMADQAEELRSLAEALCADAGFLEACDRAAAIVVGALKAGGKVLTCGNGGSATDACHLAEELVGRYRGERVALPAINLCADTGALTCIANDYGWDRVFSRQVEAYGRPGDVLVGFTTSGASPNVNAALRLAAGMGLRTIAVTGKDGGEALGLADVAIHVPHRNTARIQEIHTLALHAICEAVERAFQASPG